MACPIRFFRKCTEGDIEKIHDVIKKHKDISTKYTCLTKQHLTDTTPVSGDRTTYRHLHQNILKIYLKVNVLVALSCKGSYIVGKL